MERNSGKLLPRTPQFTKNVLEIAYKIKTTWKMNDLKKIETLNSPFYSIELCSTIKDIFQFDSKKLVEQFLYNPAESKCFQLAHSSIEETDKVICRVQHSINQDLEAKFMKNSKNEKSIILEMWNKGVILSSTKLEDFNVNKVYSDDIFGYPKFSPDGMKLIFIGEEDKNKNKKHYFDEIDQDKLHFDKFQYEEDFGELLSDKTYPSIYIFEISTLTVRKVYLNLNKIYPCQPIFDYNSSDIVFCGLHFPFFKFGPSYCPKRECQVLLIKNPVFEEERDKKKEGSAKIIQLSQKGDFFYTNMFQTFSPNFEHLIWYSNEKANPHLNGFRICKIDWTIKKGLDSQEDIDIDIERYDDLSSLSEVILNKISVENEYFNGIYSYENESLSHSFINENLFLFSTTHLNKSIVFMYDIEKKILLSLPSQNSFSSLIYINSKESIIIAVSSDVNVLPYPCIITFNYELYSKEDFINTIKLENGVDYVVKYNDNIFSSVIIDNSNSEFFSSDNLIKAELRATKSYIKNIIDAMTIEDLLIDGIHGHAIYSKSREDLLKMPVVYFIHGGPHSITQKQFILLHLLFVAHGYLVLVINYPGSTGFGQNYLTSLIGNIGRLDVEACGEFLLKALDKYENICDKNNILLYGGSHGGFLSCWLMVHDKYSQLFAASSIRNPVTDLCSSSCTSDIPDFMLAESRDENINDFYPLTKDQHSTFYDVSPVFQAGKCSTPTLLMLGKADKRVPYSNGLYFYHALVKHNCEVRLLVYPEDCHALNRIETEIDVSFNTFKWFESHLKA